MAQALAKQQNAYAAAFGYSGHDPLPLAEEGSKGGGKPKKA
jgi:hypothetical protein